MKYYSNKYKKQRQRKTIAWLMAFLLFFCAVFSYVFFVVNPVVVEATEHAIFSLSTSAVSDAVYDVLCDEEITYDDLVSVEHDQNGAVTLISLQTVTLNLIARKFYQVAQIYLDSMGKNGIDISVGAFTGLPFLTGIGPKINIKLISIGAMTSEFESEFRSAGINQTNHKVYVQLFASVSMLLPCYSARIDSVTEMLVAESVIVGKIPEIYLSGGSSSNFLIV